MVPKGLPPPLSFRYHEGQTSLKMNPDPRLSTLLRSWEDTPGVTSGFRREVWSRIESRRPTSLPGAWISLLASPRLATVAVVAAVFAGVLAGNLEARSSGESLYLRSVNPLFLHSSQR